MTAAEKKRERDRLYRVTYPEKVKASRLKWLAANPEKRREYMNKIDKVFEEARVKDAWGKKMTVRPFSNGTQYLDWESANCGRCKKAASLDDFQAGKFQCDIEKELAYGTVGDGTISDEIAARLKPDKTRYCWPCGEWEPT